MARGGGRQGVWQDKVYEALQRAGVRQVGYVPDAGHARLIERAHADPDMDAIVLTTEEEGVAMAAGAWLGGQRAVLLMQSSGVGNCINMLSLPTKLPHAVPDPGHHARRVGRVQSVAGADGQRDAGLFCAPPVCTCTAPTTPTRCRTWWLPRRRSHSTARCRWRSCSRSG